MGYFREIIAFQNLKCNKAQIVELIKNLLTDGWSLKCREDNDEIQYTLNAGDWIISSLDKQEELLKELNSLDIEKSWGGTQLLNKRLNRIVWIYQYEHKYRFELQIGRDENELQLFEELYEELKPSIQKLTAIIHVEWKTHYSNDIIRSITDQYHEGVLILASSNKIKQHYSQNKFNYDFPIGIKELLDSRIIIAVNCWDYSFQTIVETERITEIDSKLVNFIDFDKDDKLLILHHGQFTMICDDKKGDYTQYGFKDIIINIPIEFSGLQGMTLSRSGDEYEGELIIQFNNNSSTSKANSLLQINEVPTHNSR